VKTSRSLKIAAAIAVSALALTGVNASVANAADAKKIYALGGTDPFFTVVKNGFDAAKAAVEADGHKATWLAIKDWSNIGPDMNKILKTALDSGADAIATPIWVPATQNPAITAAVKGGTPVFLYNTGLTERKKVGALAYYGSDEFPAGKALGAYLKSLKVKHILCANMSPGTVNHEARCAGTKAGAAGVKFSTLNIDITKFKDATAVANAVKGALAKDKTIDAVAATSNGDAVVAGVKAAGSKAKVGTFDMTNTLMDFVEKGDTAVALVDQQGWLQSFLATTAAWYYSAYGILPATADVLTGPALITKANATKVKAGVKSGQR
jgi:simple sugar transport system substrate-binding protein